MQKYCVEVTLYLRLGYKMVKPNFLLFFQRK
jgi:hypothetical protein